MKMLESIISFLQFRMQRPTIYGWFHILCIVCVIGVTIFLVLKKYDVKKTLLVLSTIMLLFEVYKQLSFSFNDGKWEYQWYAFPFQFCSVPMYIAFIASFVKNSKIEKCLYGFLATYGLVAGIGVMAYPVTVFIEEILINIQTMVHHGFMVVIGLVLLINGHVKLNYQTIINGFWVFLIAVCIAVSVNTVTYLIDFEGGLELFFISPFHASSLPVFSTIYPLMPYPIFLVLYLLVFTIGGFIPIGVVYAIKKLTKKSVGDN